MTATTSWTRGSKIQIGTSTFIAIETVDLKGTHLVPQHAIEDQYTVQDHIFEQPASYQFTLSLDRENNEHITFADLISVKKLHSVITPLRSFDHMSIDSYAMQMSDSENIIYATITLSEIRKAQSQFVAGSGYTGPTLAEDLGTKQAQLDAIAKHNTDTNNAAGIPAPPTEGNSIWDTIIEVAKQVLPYAVTPIPVVGSVCKLVGYSVGNALAPGIHDLITRQDPTPPVSQTTTAIAINQTAQNLPSLNIPGISLSL